MNFRNRDGLGWLPVAADSAHPAPTGVDTLRFTTAFYRANLDVRRLGQISVVSTVVGDAWAPIQACHCARVVPASALVTRSRADKALAGAVIAVIEGRKQVFCDTRVANAAQAIDAVSRPDDLRGNHFANNRGDVGGINAAQRVNGLTNHVMDLRFISGATC